MDFQSIDFKETLILPNTSFPMRGNLPQNEPKIYAQWAKSAYSKMQKNRANLDSIESGAKDFTLHDGPPYANGHIHIGHALNKILKDIIVKIHYFSGKHSFYTPGWDCHGLPIEQQIETKLGRTKKESLPKNKIRELCRAHASEFVGIQKDEFSTLGIVGDFEKPYLTMDFAFEAAIYRNLCAIAKKGLLKERSKPVYWSWAAKTALAEAEVEYEEKESDSIFVAFALQEDALNALKAALNLDSIKNASVVIWTTTPWTLPANTGVALNPNAKYALTSDYKIILAERVGDLAESGICEERILGTFGAEILENKLAKNPLNNRDSKIILGEHVSENDGTGCVHTAPGHGEDDYFVGLKYNLEVLMPVDDDGKFDESLSAKKLAPDELVGQFIFSTHDRICELLGSALLKRSKIKHSYPHCWRTHKPVIFRATKQWFILMDEPFSSDGRTLRQVALDELKKVRFYPEQGRNRISTMIENRPDWCISRQRDWGVPIAFFRDKRTKEPILEPSVLDFVADIFEREGCDAWNEREVADLLPPHLKSEAVNFEKINHILDVWFDSGSTWEAVLNSGKYAAGSYPADMYLEGSDQHRGWFHSSLLVSCAINEKAPYKSVLTHGFTMDENGEKMSKSKGNVIAPQEVSREFGAEILRLWVALSDYQNDQRMGKNILKQISENYRKIRNTLRFLLANIEDLPKAFEPNSADFSEIDLWILHRAKSVFGEVWHLFCEYEFAKGSQELNFFLNGDLSGVYLDLCKDILYCDGLNSKTRRAVQSAMAHICASLCGLLAPFFTYTINEALNCSKSAALKELLGLDSMKNPKSAESGSEIDPLLVFDIIYKEIGDFKEPKRDFTELLALRAAFLEKIDTLKKDGALKSTLEANLHILSADENNKQSAESLASFGSLAGFLMVSSIVDSMHNSQSAEILSEFSCGGINFAICKASGCKCPRCWQFTALRENEPCARCLAVLKENFN